jgi:hypothetical protein
MSNKVITSVNSLLNNVSIPINKTNDVICIDTLNNRLGIKKANPLCELDVSGNIEGIELYISKIYGNVNSDLSTLILDGSANFINNLHIGGNLIVDGSLLVQDYNTETFGMQINYNLNDLDISYIYYNSDDRLKHNEKPITNGLEILRKLNPQIYQKTQNFKNSDYRGELIEPNYLEAGLIAQEVLEINDLSYTVRIGDQNTPYSLNYNNIFVYGLSAIKELDKKLNTFGTFSNIENLEKYENLIKNQASIIQILNSKINNIEEKIKVLEKK